MLSLEIFLWMLWHNSVQIGEQLKIKKGKGSEKCKYCEKLEIRNHLFFNCIIAQVIWVWVRISVRWNERPISIQHFEDLMGIGLGSIRDSSMFWSVCPGACGKLGMTGFLMITSLSLPKL
jgi:hypothetical protein